MLVFGGMALCVSRSQCPSISCDHSGLERIGVPDQPVPASAKQVWAMYLDLARVLNTE